MAKDCKISMLWELCTTWEKTITKNKTWCMPKTKKIKDQYIATAKDHSAGGQQLRNQRTTHGETTLTTSVGVNEGHFTLIKVASSYVNPRQVYLARFYGYQRPSILALV